MAEYAQERKLDRKAVDEREQSLEGNNEVDQSLEEILGEDGVFLNELREVV